MKQLALLISLVFVAVASFAQPFGNEWINYTQPHYRVKVKAEGIYRLRYVDLVAAGVPLPSDPRNLQMYGRQNELFIHVEAGTGDPSVFDAADYIEFYAPRNDGWFDASMYPANKHPNPYYSNYTDTASFYLTWNSSINNRRMSNDNLSPSPLTFASYTLSSYIWQESALFYKNIYGFGKQDSEHGKTPIFSESEGWGEYEFFNTTGSRKVQDHFNLNTANFFAAGPPAIASFGVISTSDPSGPNSHHLSVKHDGGTTGAIYTTLLDTLFDGYKLINRKYSIPAANLGATATRFRFATESSLVDSPSDRMTLTYVALRFPKTTDMGGVQQQIFWTPDNPVIGQDKAHLLLTNYTTAASNVYVYVIGPNKVVRTEATLNGSDYEVLLDDNGTDKQCFITNETQIVNITNIKPVTGTGYFTNYEALNYDSAYLIVSHKSLWTQASNYANYRTSQGENVVLADIEELYDQFAAGIQKHPLAIRNFADLLLNRFPTDPQNLLLIGKSMQGTRENGEGQPDRGSRHFVTAYAGNLVPSYGYPCSDIMLTAGLNGSALWRPAIATGRISATTGQEVANYLNKITEYENYGLYPKDEWMKNVMHFGGGSDSQEQDRFAGYLKSYQTTIEDTCFGGKVHEFLKNSSTPISINLTDSVKDRINDGTTIMTFFGHAAGSGFDQNIDSPDGYQNTNGKYPLIIGNSCYTGDVHAWYGGSTAEIFVLHQRGAIGFIANVKQGYAGELHRYCSQLYTNISSTGYGKSIGKAMQNTIETVYASQSNNFAAEQTCLLNSLQGDPALVLHSFDLPDYELSGPNVYTIPELLSTEMDSFEVVVVVNNFEKAVGDTVGVEVARHFQQSGMSCNDTVYTQVAGRIAYAKELRFKLGIDHDCGPGMNTFTVRVDLPENAILESDDFMNNEHSFSKYIISPRLYPIYPYKFAVIPNNKVTLQASTGDPKAPARNYRLQIDTTDLFNSPFLRTTLINEEGGVVSWDPGLTFTDSTVYFWRCSPDSVDAAGYKWEESSFQYIPGKSGWGQAHYYQCKENTFQGVEYDRPNRDYDFPSGTRTLSCNSVGAAANNNQWYRTRYSIGNQLQSYGGCGTVPSVHVAIIDPNTLQPWETRFFTQNPNNDFGNLNNDNVCSNTKPYKAFFFRQWSIPGQMDSLRNFINNKVPDGHYILMYAYIQGVFFYFDPSMATAFTNLGATAGLTSLFGGGVYRPFIFFAEKGNPATAIEVVGASLTDEISFAVDVPFSGKAGVIATPTIGPTPKWGSLHWNMHAKEAMPFDSTGINVYGIQFDGTESLLASFDESLGEVLNLDTYVDAAQYPYLRLDGFFRDDSTLTPAQLDNWHVLYDPVPEAAVSYHDGYYLGPDTAQQGEEVDFLIAIRNVSETDMDSLLVSYVLETESHKRFPLPYARQAPLKAGATLLDTLKFNTSNYKGKNSILVEVNPISSVTNAPDQLEQSHFNNYFYAGHVVIGDDVNPILDVTFDGIHILNGDIISPKPEIFITLNDENSFLVLNEIADTARFSIFIAKPGGILEQVWFNLPNGEAQLIFVPAKSAKENFTIQYNPEFTTEGTYKMLIWAEDKSGNNSGDYAYEIEFEVILESTITEIINYPNPFSTRTQFVFTLTGSEVPDEFRIQIMSVSGKVVREIGTDEIGPVRIGRNVTEYYWNGTDQYGDQLANGVYLYRTITKINNEDIELRPTAAADYFKRGFGKMYLMR